ncbi:MAG: CRISPR-associated endonuclease Cas1 [Desulfurococcaceae archaeon]
MKTILISGYGVRLRYRKGLLIIESSRNEVREIPLHDIEQVVITTSGVWFSSKLLRVFMEQGVDFIVLDSRGYPIGRLYPPFINRTVDTRRAQYSAYGSDKCIYLIREIVYSKLVNQAGLLKKYYYYTRIDDLKKSFTKIAELAVKARYMELEFNELKERLRVIEAESARIFWSNYAMLIPRDLGFESRDQDSPDPVNLSLNYSYGILYSECWKALVLAGLDPYAGFLHEDRSGKPVLVFDFIEMFRFIADVTLLNLFRRNWKPIVINNLLDYNSRRKIIEAMNKFMEETKSCYIDENPVNLKQIIKKVALKLASHLRGESVFEGYVHRW